MDISEAAQVVVSFSKATTNFYVLKISNLYAAQNSPVW